MTADQEREMHALAIRLVELTRGSGWEAMRYIAVGLTMEQLAEYCAVCHCQKRKVGPQGEQARA